MLDSNEETPESFARSTEKTTHIWAPTENEIICYMGRHISLFLGEAEYMAQSKQEPHVLESGLGRFGWGLTLRVLLDSILMQALDTA